MQCGSSDSKGLLSPLSCWALGLSSVSTTPNLSANKQQILNKLFFLIFLLECCYHKIKATLGIIFAWYLHWDSFSQCKTRKSGVGAVVQKLFSHRWVKGSCKTLLSLPLIAAAWAPRGQGGASLGAVSRRRSAGSGLREVSTQAQESRCYCLTCSVPTSCPIPPLPPGKVPLTGFPCP